METVATTLAERSRQVLVERWALGQASVAGRAVDFVDVLRDVEIRRSSRQPRAMSTRFTRGQVSSPSPMARFHLPVATDRSPISSNIGNGARLMSGPAPLVSLRNASPGRPLMTVAQRSQKLAGTPSRTIATDRVCRGSQPARWTASCSRSDSISYVCRRSTLARSAGL